MLTTPASIEDKFWDCSNAEYHGSTTEDSHSSIDLFIDSVEQYAALRVFKSIPRPEPTPEMKFGSLFHTAVLEPELLDEEYAVFEKFDRRTKEGKAGFADFCRRTEGQTIVEQSEMDLAMAMREGLMRNEQAELLMIKEGYNEKAFRWTDPDTGCPLKVRMDKFIPRKTILGSKICEALIVDLKTTKDVSPEAWSKTVHNFGYHRQVAMYVDGVSRVFGLIPHFIFIACSKIPPHECVCYDLKPAAILLGQRQNADALQELSNRRRTNNWHGRWAGSIHNVDLPRYAYSS